ncbi:DciA family protein [Nitrosomonas sp.]|uniref:DciA family protein n=1 Tax=Nitrosomonas sp. TaxID=42353 RepID=UPI001DD8C384|nr:DciA family protein [Nitrosomonas sp.]MBX3618033.1 DUF721 domain-containing protein [Nitrosomonas sp.]
MPPHKVDSYLNLLGKAPEYESLLSTARQLSIDQSIFHKLIPVQLTQYCSLSRITNGKLTILAENGAIAAKLKQLSPSLLCKLQQYGWEVTSFQILVQAQNSATNSKYYEKHRDKTKPKLSVTGKECFNQLAATLPDSELRDAIHSLLKKQEIT